MPHHSTNRLDLVCGPTGNRQPSFKLQEAMGHAANPEVCCARQTRRFTRTEGQDHERNPSIDSADCTDVEAVAVADEAVVVGIPSSILPSGDPSLQDTRVPRDDS